VPAISPGGWLGSTDTTTDAPASAFDQDPGKDDEPAEHNIFADDGASTLVMSVEDDSKDDAAELSNQYSDDEDTAGNDESVEGLAEDSSGEGDE
jgi:hypothetical protein